jgi:hypothetical protein
MSKTNSRASASAINHSSLSAIRPVLNGGAVRIEEIDEHRYFHRVRNSSGHSWTVVEVDLRKHAKRDDAYLEAA